MKKLYKIFILLIISTFISMFIVGCNEKNQEESNKINLWINSTEKEGEAISKLVEKWSVDNGIEVNIVVNNNAEGNVDEYLNRTQGENSPDIEFGLSHEYIEQLVELNLAEEIKSDIVDFDSYISKDLIYAVTINGKIYAYPISQECAALYYNKDLVKDVPSTMDELIEDAKIKGFQYDINNLYLSYGFLSANGGYSFKNNDGTFNKDDIGFNTQGAIEGYELLRNLTQVNKLIPEEVNDNLAELAFTSGKSAYYIGEAKKLDMMESFPQFSVGVIPIPDFNGNSVKPFKGVKISLVNPYSTKKEESYKLLKYIIENSKDVLINEGNRLPVFKDALEFEAFKNDPAIQGFYEQSKTAEIMPNIIYTVAMWNPTVTNLTLLTTDQITPEECGKNIDEQIKQGITMIKR